MATGYLTSEQDAKLRRWERWNRNYFIFAFVALVIILVFSSQLGLSSGESWGPLGFLLVALVTPIIILQLRLACPACGVKDRKSTRLNSSHVRISYAVFCLKKKINSVNDWQ